MISTDVMISANIRRPPVATPLEAGHEINLPHAAGINSRALPNRFDYLGDFRHQCHNPVIILAANTLSNCSNLPLI